MDTRNAPPPQTLWIVWGAMLASLIAYLAISWVVPVETRGSAPGVPAAALGLVAATTAAASFVLRRVLVAAPIEKGSLDPDTAAGRARVFQASVLCWTLSESVGIQGLVLFFLYGSRPLLYAFLAAALVLLLLHAPREWRAASSMDRARPDVKIG